MVLFVLAEVVKTRQADLGRSDALVEVCQQFGLVLELVVFGFEWFQLYSHDLLVGFVESVVDFAEGAPGDSAEKFVVLADHYLHSNYYGTPLQQLQA